MLQSTQQHNVYIISLFDQKGTAFLATQRRCACVVKVSQHLGLMVHIPLASLHTALTMRAQLLHQNNFQYIGTVYDI
jgi:hypothetical protein